MAKIFYSVCGVGLGHAMRSTPLINFLLDSGHEVIIASYWNAFDYLKKKFGQHQEAKVVNILANQENYKFKLEFYDVPVVPNVLAENFLKISKNVKNFDPDLIISDFDIFSSLIGFIQDIPVLMVSNVHLSEYYKIKLGIKDQLNYMFKERAVINGFPRVNRLFLFGFVRPKELPKNVKFFFHPVREEIISLRPQKKDFFLVYSLPKELDKIIPLLKKFEDKKFVVYGANKHFKSNNLTVKTFDQNDFSYDLANCAGVMSHGGLSTICESIYLKKPLYLFCDTRFFERFYNAKLVQEKKIGYMEEKPTFNGLKHFFDQLPSYEKYVEKIEYFPENQKITKEIKKLIEEHSAK